MSQFPDSSSEACPDAKRRFRTVPRGWTEPLVERYREAVIAKVTSMEISNYRLAQYTRLSPSMLGLILRRESLPGLETTGRICHVDDDTLRRFFTELLRGR